MYFGRIPDLLYLKYNKNPFDGHYIQIKNIFARIKLVDDIIPSATLFNDYFIKDGERPDTISFDFYEDPTYDWTILLINNIKNLYEDWPMGRRAFESYIGSKYSNPYEIHHYETIEQYWKGSKLLEGGLEVGESFQFKMPDQNLVPKSQSRVAIDNYTYEERKNDKRREILLLRPEFIEAFVEIFEKQMQFTPSTEYVSQSLKIIN
jgi:hypothetical protein